MYVKVIDRGECFSTTNEAFNGIPANRTEWAKYNFYPQNDMVGEVVKDDGDYLVKFAEGIYVPFTKRGVVEISAEEYHEAKQNEGPYTGMDERQKRLNDELDAYLAKCAATVPPVSNHMRLKQLDMNEQLAMIQLAYQLIISANYGVINENDDTSIDIIYRYMGYEQRATADIVWNTAISSMSPWDAFNIVSNLSSEKKNVFKSMINEVALKDNVALRLNVAQQIFNRTGIF